MSYYITSPRKSVIDTFFNAAYETRSTSVPKADVYSDEQAYYLELELPGYAKDEIAITVKEGALTITAQHKDATEDTGRAYHIRERGAIKFERSFKLGDTLDSDKISATHENGILKLSVAKKEKALPKAITIE